MEDVVIDPRVFAKSKVHPTIIEQIRREMMKNPGPNRPPPPRKKKWQEIPVVEGARWAANCRRENGKVVIIGIRKAKMHKIRVKSRKERKKYGL